VEEKMLVDRDVEIVMRDGLRILTSLEEVAEEQNATQAEVGLAWLVAQPGIVAPIIGVRSVAQLNGLIKNSAGPQGIGMLTD
jgi:aryl-alcohol dehydrogenase-like predicted oxidoreductase